MVTITRKITTSCFSTVAAKKEKRHTCTKTVPLSYDNLFMSFFDLTPQASQVNCTNKLLLGSFMLIVTSCTTGYTVKLKECILMQEKREIKARFTKFLATRISS